MNIETKGGQELPHLDSTSRSDVEKISHEIELKIVNLGEEAEFAKRVEKAGGRLIKPERLLRDTYFKLSEDKKSGPEQILNIKVSDFDSADNLKQALVFLGLEIQSQDNKNILVKKPGGAISRRLARLRFDKEDLMFTVKERRTDTDWHSEVDERLEAEVGVKNIQAVEELLFSLQYKLISTREKLRTTYMVSDTLVELNKGPVGKPWGEIEGENAEKIFKVAESLGYKKEDLARLSDGDYYRAQGVLEKDLKKMLFESPPIIKSP